MARFLQAILWACLFAMAVVIPPARAAVYVSGKVVSADNAPVAGASVTLFKQDQAQPVDSAISLGNGAYVVKAPEAGTYRITVSGKDFAAFNQEFQVPASGLPSLDLKLAPLPALRLKVLGIDGKPDAGASLQVWGSFTVAGRALPPVARTPTSSADGLVSMTAGRDASPALISNITISIRDAHQGCGQKTLDRWPDGEVVIPLEKGAHIGGTVVDDDGKPVPHVEVIATRMIGLLPTPAGRVSVTTNDAGEYDIPALFYGTYAVRTMIPGVGMRGRVLTLTKDKLEVKLNPDDSTRQPGFNLPPAPRMPNILPRLAPPGMRWHWRLLPPILPNGGQRQQQTPDHDNPGEQTARPA